MNKRPKNPIFIIGLYKCGTTWLLSALSAPPQALGLREFDVIRAATVKGADRIELPPPEERAKAFFARSSWCMADPDTALEALQISPEKAAALIRNSPAELKIPDDRRSGRPGIAGLLPRTFYDLDAESATEMIRAVKEAKYPEQLVGRFIELAATPGEAGGHVVLKAADQIAVFDKLQAFFPDAPKIVIMRDGRDAAISALHYRKYMKTKKAPWLKQTISYQDQLKGWVSRARMVRERLQRNELLVIRYEDMTVDFAATFSALLSRLGLDHSPETVEHIRSFTSFEAMAGRRHGDEDGSIFRKGITGEWLEYLDAKEKKRSWNIAGDILRFFGYGKDGKNADFPLPM